MEVQREWKSVVLKDVSLWESEMVLEYIVVNGCSDGPEMYWEVFIGGFL